MKKTDFCSFLLVVVVTIGMLSACGSSSDYPEPVKLDEIMQVAEVEKLIGSKVDQPPMIRNKVTEDSGFWMTHVNYYAPDVNLSVGIMVQPFGDPKFTAEEASQQYKKNVIGNMADYKMDPVSGIGENAVWNPQIMQLTVFNNGCMIIVTGGSRDKSNEENLAFAKELGSMVIAKLQK